MPRRSKHTGLEEHPSKDKQVRVSSGRGGSGNIIPETQLSLNLNHEAELLLQRRMKREEESCTKYLKKHRTGRGGVGNIQAASTAQWITYDKSLDPDDSYEEIVVERNYSSPRPLRTGRGGSGNNLLKPAASPKALVSGPSLLSLSSSSGSSSRLSRASFASSSYSSPFGGHHHQRLSESSSLFTRFSKSKQRLSATSDESSESAQPRGSQWWKLPRAITPLPSSECSEIPRLIINDCHSLHDDTIAVLQIMERFEEEEEEEAHRLEVPDLQTTCPCASTEETPDEDELADEFDDEDAEWAHDVLVQAQYEISFHEL